MFNRVLFGYAVVCAGAFAVLYSISSGWLRRATVWLFGAILAIFIYQVNLWHEYQLLRNIAEMDIARTIRDRLQEQPGYDAKLPLVMIGTYKPEDYLFYRVFNTQTGPIQNTANASVYELLWARDRILPFFMPATWATPDQAKHAMELAEGAPHWPAKGSAFVRDGLMVVVLGEAEKPSQPWKP